ncbi:LLM class flavin-dependent oxidoreductase [Streptomyces indonesiensis]
MPTALNRLTHPGGRLTLGLELPLDNDWGQSRLATDRKAGRPFGVPSLDAHAHLARLADRSGFAALWVRDVPLYDPVHFGDAGSVFETFTHLGHLAAVTERAVLGTAAVVLPLRRPLLVAKAAATVDALSCGRFVLGLASGDRPVEWPRPPSRSAATPSAGPSICCTRRTRWCSAAWAPPASPRRRGSCGSPERVRSVCSTATRACRSCWPPS